MTMLASLPPSAQPDDPIYRLTVEQYHEMSRNRTIRSGSAVELLEGVPVHITGRNPPHRASTYRTTKALEGVVPPGWYVDRQEPMTTDDSEPELDVYVARGDTRDYLDRPPGPADCALVVKVADSTLAHDRGVKRRLYARAGVPVYWIVAIPDRAVEVYTDPAGAAYSTTARFADGEHVPVMIDGVQVGRTAVADLLP
jgi:Uma2 family endonuclease